IPKHERLPLDVEGTQIGEIDGDFDLKLDASPDQKLWNLDVAIPVMHIELPVSARHAVQELSEPERMRVGIYRARSKELVVLAIDGEDVDEAAHISSGR